MSTDVYSTGPTVVCSEFIGLVSGASSGAGAGAYVDTELDYGREAVPAACAATMFKSHVFENAYVQASSSGDTLYLARKDVTAVNTNADSPNSNIEYEYVQTNAGF